MNKIINKHQAICGVVWIVVFCIIILRPLSKVTEKHNIRSNQEMSMQSGAIKGDCLAAQKFIAPYSHLKDIRIYLLNETYGGELRFILFDAEMNVVSEQNIIVEAGEELPGLYTVKMNQDVETGGEYWYMIQGVSEDFYVAYEDTETSGTSYSGTLFYNGMEVKGYNIITEYDYEIAFGKGKALACYTFIVLFGVLISFLSKKHYEKNPEKNRLLTVERVWKCVAGPIVIVSAIVLMIAIWPCNMFSNDNDYVLFGIPDIIFFETGILIAAGILLYGVYHKRNHKSNDMGLAILRDRWTDYLQAVFFAMSIQSTVHYMNALYENQHIIAYREMLIYFGLAVIVTYKRKEIFNWINLGYLVIAGIAGYLYYQAQVIFVETEDEMRILKLTVWAAVIAGIVIINTIFILVRRNFGKISVYGIILALFFALLIIFRNTRGWTIYLVCVFSLYYLRMSAWDKKGRLLCNICNGILLNFMVMTGYCLLHRPYLYMEARFPFAFHTATVSAEYLSLAVCAAFVKLMQAYRREAKLSNIWKELTIFGISTVYLILTISRTGYLAIVMMLLVVIPVVCLGTRHKFKSLSVLAASLSAAVIICFPPVFTMQRIVPSVVAQPEMFAIEWIPEDIDVRNTHSWYYMTIRRFVQVFEMKVLGISEDECIKPYRILYYGNNDKMLIASTNPSGAMVSDEMDEALEEGKMESYANGRLDIFKLYIANLNMTGHDDMEIILPDGTSGAVHAHNTYIQAAYDHGIPVGIAFILFGFCTLIQSVVYYKRRKDSRLCSLLPFALLLTFAAAGLTEWLFHPCNPITFCMLSALAPLLCDMGSRDNLIYS